MGRVNRDRFLAVSYHIESGQFDLTTTEDGPDEKPRDVTYTLDLPPIPRLGMIGSRRKVKLIVDDLIERGVPAHLFDDLHAPIGLDIGAVSVEEIAVSIAAQLVEVRRTSDQRSPVTGPVPTGANQATIVETHPAPSSCTTK